jgi:hypothetical protein
MPYVLRDGDKLDLRRAATIPAALACVVYHGPRVAAIARPSNWPSDTLAAKPEWTRCPLDAFYLSVSISPSRRNSAGTGRTRSIGPGSTRVDLAGGVRHLREPKWRPRLAIWKDLMGGDGIRFDPAWASWEYHTVRRMAQAIDHTRDFDQMPILGDALEDAGCHTRGHP